MGKLPVMAAFVAANHFLRIHGRAAGGAIALCVVGGLISAVGEYKDAEVMTAFGSVEYIAGWVMATGALMRLAFADEHPGDPAFVPGALGFQWSRVEGRLLAVNMLLALAVAAAIFPGLLLAIAGAAAVFSKEGAAPTAGGLPMMLIGITACVGAGLYVGVRLSLAPPATVARRQIALAWDLGKGQIGPMLAAYFLTFLQVVGLCLAVALVVGVALGAAGVPAQGRGLALIVQIAQALIIPTVQVPLGVGLTAYLYRGLRPPGSD